MNKESLLFDSATHFQKIITISLAFIKAKRITFIQMKTKTLTILLICLSGLPIWANETAKSPVRLAAENTERLLTSMRDGDRETFIANSSEEFTQAMTPLAFSEARQKLLPILNRPSKLDFLGSINKQTSILYLYRLRPEGTGVDSLVTTSMSQGKINGFFLN